MSRTLGKTCILIAIGLLFIAYSIFIPTAFASETIGDYIKNHFIREIIFGLTLTGWTLWITLKHRPGNPITFIALLGSAIVLPFWIGTLLGWSTGDMAAVWEGAMTPQSAYLYHSGQVFLFYIGLAFLWKSQPRT